MADSDDEYDKKRRDKFQGERTESYRDRRKDDEWGRSRMRSDYRDRYPSYQNDMPPAKRIRYEPDEVRGGGMRFQPHFNMWGGGGPPEPAFGGGGGGFGANPRSSDLDTQPPIMTFKAFLQTQDDNITDEEAIAKYAEYKLEFRRQQLNEFFVAHKEEEWFKLKYHPEDSAKRKEELNNALKKRAQVYLEMLNSGRVDSVRLDSDQGDAVVKLLDAVVIRLEGGTDLDLTVLDIAENASQEKAAKEAAEKAKEAKLKADKEKAEKEKAIAATERGDEAEKSDKADDGENAENESENAEKSIDSTAEASAENPNEEKEQSNKEDDDKDEGIGDEKKETDVEEMDADEPSESKDEPKQKEKSKSPEPEIGEKDAAETKDSEKKEEEEIKTHEIDSDKEGEVVPLTPRPLHRTSSIFLRTISPRVTRAEIETICKKYPGFLRVSLSDPQPEQHWYRRGWITFRRDVNIKEICWNLNSVRVKDGELGAIVNRDLSRRVRSVSALSAHKTVVLNDLKLAARIIQELDSRHKIWNQNESSESSFGLHSDNPILKDITEYLVEEASAEEEELLGQGVVPDDSKNKHAQAIKVLDRLLLYLRIVYSVDYYNMSQYASEDENPNRCGIMHLRGMPSNSNTEVIEKEVNDYCEQYKTKLDHLMRPPEQLSDSELASLGAKSEDVEVEKFIQANTQELAKDKWLCPLSGKKFKGAQFVKKHIFNKFSDQLDEVKKEVEYFNNYLRDPKRPQLAEHPGARAGKKENVGPPEPPYHQFQYGGPAPGPFKRGFNHFGGGYPFPRGRGGMPPRGRPAADYRPLIAYRDLDAPCEPDEII
ncbi:Serrate RNA effector molecule homolog [Nesidiocoris tenuis]|uniref:Serrate RNA effector molecule homolog n=1 Tax=Nesidiocoris tenuis TaxID=355587 RepID=A0ABN7B7K7_9HEMI|nr:Serrate RNA effector molecule homolog [Nesidiocoris tenuis]